MKICTFNIHNFTNSDCIDSTDNLVTLINKNNYDIIALQEVTDEKDLKLFVKKLKLEYNYLYNRHNALLSIYSIKNNLNKNTKERYTSCLLTISKNFILNVLNIHLNYKCEYIRIEEIRKIFSSSNKYINKYPTIVMGDFNALTKEDYSNKELVHIIKERKYSKWETPVYDLTNTIKDEYKFKDTRMLSNKTGDNGTSRFNTRIDYIFINDSLKDLLINIDNNHIHLLNKISDHNLVELCLKLK